ncbi:aspartate/glutamate racemase family protein [Tindallia californiensis]|uniref:Asp/Glu/Hydantoin racemase n=1 Tax=Tindallia californiensis TaxID=159292 RepID=A0A1H3PAS3_9FIRM|nr:aspartate/glutamate racemase family protein [Tindallia californiensis]SDY97925.1 Asp/Glu/Hydantoin racemase [Tindallia californiensis]
MSYIRNASGRFTDHLIGIIGGTPVDAHMGVTFFQQRGVKTIGVGLSASPEEATLLQVLYPLKLQRLITREILLMKQTHRISKVCIFCNSLSAAINLEELQTETGLRIITPLNVYQQTAHLYDKVGLLAANCQSLRGIENVIMEARETTQVVGTALLQLVIAIEKATPPETIMQEQGLFHLLKFFETIGVPALILGCTHFPYLKKSLESHTFLEIIDPAEEMLSMLLTS